MSKEQQIESVAYGLLSELPDWCDATNSGDLWEKALAFAAQIVEEEEAAYKLLDDLPDWSEPN